MERERNTTLIKRSAFILLLIAMLPYAHGQGSSNYNQRLYASYVKGEMAPWRGIIQEMSQEYDRTGEQALLYDH